MKEASLVEVYGVRGKSYLPRVECLLVHLYEPRDNKVQPASQKWGKACPVCRLHDRVRERLHSLPASLSSGTRLN